MQGRAWNGCRTVLDAKPMTESIQKYLLEAHPQYNRAHSMGGEQMIEIRWEEISPLMRGFGSPGWLRPTPSCSHVVQASAESGGLEIQKSDR